MLHLNPQEERLMSSHAKDSVCYFHCNCYSEL